MNPVVLALATVAAIAGGAAGSFAVSKMREPQTKTGDAFDDTTNALLLTPAAPYSAAAKVMRPFVERGANALAREFAPVPKPRKRKKAAKSCECNEGEMQEDLGFVSIGAGPVAPEQPSPYFRQCHTDKKTGKTVCKNYPLPPELYKKKMDEWRKAMKVWNEARTFDARIAAEKAKVEEQMRRATARNELEALKKKHAALTSAQKLTSTPGALPRLKFGKDAMLKWYQSVAKNGVPGNLDPNSLMQALAQFGNQHGLPGFGMQQSAFPPGTGEPYMMEPDQNAQFYTVPQRSYELPQPQEPLEWPVGFEPQMMEPSFDPFGDSSMLPGLDLADVPGEFDGMFGVNDLEVPGESFFDVEGAHDPFALESNAGNADSICCASCSIGGPCGSGECAHS